MNFQDAMREQGVKPIKGYKSYQEWQCSRKLSFPTEAQANDKLKHLRTGYRVYLCDLCGQYHLTSSKERGSNG